MSFMTFLTVAILLYAAMHAYVYRRIVRAFVLRRTHRFTILVFFACMIVTPFAGRLLDRSDGIAATHWVNLVGYVWMLWVFWFCMAGWTIDITAAIVTLARRLRGVPPAPRQSDDPDRRRRARRQFYALAALIVAATLWGTIEAAHPIARYLTIRAPVLDGKGAPLRIVQVSDVHLNTVRGNRWSRAVARQVRELKPDLLLSTGDLIDAPFAHIADQADPWADFHPPLGKYAILGNHEYYAGLRDALAFHEHAGFTLLRGQSADVTTGLRVTGVDDATGLQLREPCFCDESAALAGAPAGHPFVLFLKHQPRIAPSSLGCFDLQLSGHTHGGQVFPFQLFVRMLYPVRDGFTRLDSRSALYVSRGTGTWGPPLRFLARPEITVITLMVPP